MAYQIFWKIPFKSLRTGDDYCVNIYKDGTLPSGYPLTLNGGSQPFFTQEDDDEDMFANVRTQSGYLRIIDDGRAVTSGNAITTFNWKDLLPNTDTDRPVTLTRRVGSSNIVVWQGYMQAQNFSGVLYGGTQERAFPIQCPLTILEGFDVNYEQTGIQNFAYLIKLIIDSIPALDINYIYVQGGEDAQDWLLKRLDWQNFCGMDGDGNLIARYNLFQCLEDICRFWGWTARVNGASIYFSCADDASLSSWLKMSSGHLTSMVGGTAAGTTNNPFVSVTLSGDIFASTGNEDFRQRGPNKALVTTDTNRGDDKVINPFNDAVIKEMNELGSSHSWISYKGKNVFYTNDLLEINQHFLVGSCREGYASFNIADISDSNESINVIRIKKTGGNNVTPFVSLETVYEHNFSDGFFRMFGETYRFTTVYHDPFGDYKLLGRSFMYARIGIGKNRSTAKWWNGREWSDSLTFCRISIGNDVNTIDNDNNEFCFMYLQYPQAGGEVLEDWATNVLNVNGLSGRLFIDLLGTDNTRVGEIEGERSFELKDFCVEFMRNPGVTKTNSASDMVRITELERPTQFGYKSSNHNNVRMEWNADCIFATENACKFCYGELINPDGSFVEHVTYGEEDARPEQHLANRVTSYWASAKRKMVVELRADVVDDITPLCKVSIDGTLCYPISVNRDWWNDTVRLTLLEL